MVTLEREFIESSVLRGKVLLLDFWGTWCKPCVEAVPFLRDLHKKYADEAFVLLSISSDSNEEIVRDFTVRNRMTWLQYWDRDRRVQQAFGIRAYPTYVLIDDEGIVRFRTSGGGRFEHPGLEDAIKKQLKAAAGRTGSRHRAASHLPSVGAVGEAERP